jgi:hypothetical protein
MILLRFGFDPDVHGCHQRSIPSVSSFALPTGAYYACHRVGRQWLAGSSDHPSGLISVKPVWGLPQGGRSGPGALVGLHRVHA